MAVNGILLVDKPEGWTSHDVVAKLRGVFHERRIGHSGTLDPMATGLLVLFIGRSTRAVEFAENHEKEYIAGLRLGLTTDTQDITGNVLTEAPAAVSEQQLQAALCAFRGEISQLPPMYSAIKINGKKLYELARRGEEVERRPRLVNISRIELLGSENGDHMLSVRCSKGTYIRTLCSDIGQHLGCGGVMSSLRRVTCGVFRLEDAHSITEITEAAQLGTVESFLLPTDSLFFAHPETVISSACERKCRSGAEFGTECADGLYRVYSETGEFLMLGNAVGGRMKNVKNFFEVK